MSLPIHLRQPSALLLLALCVAAGPAAAQTPAPTGVNPASPAGPLSRDQAKMDRDAFLKMHRWDEPTDMWVLKSGVEPPVGVKSRMEVKAERDRFLSGNRWDETAGGWKPMAGVPKSTLTREQVRMETEMFLKTHRWDEETEAWVMKAQPAKK